MGLRPRVDKPIRNDCSYRRISTALNAPFLGFFRGDRNHVWAARFEVRRALTTTVDTRCVLAQEQSNRTKKLSDLEVKI